MKTPICDAVKRYANSSPVRLHMPGHKGSGPMGFEAHDITEIDGMDILYHENGILAESQNNATKLFGSQKTLYSTEGATLAIRAMLFLAKTHIQDRPILAARNAHKSFLTGCALLDINPLWIQGEESSLLSCKVDASLLQFYFENCAVKPGAVYVTSPDYLGNVMDIQALAKVCHDHDALLLVDNAHGAYLRFLPDSPHR